MSTKNDSIFKVDYFVSQLDQSLNKFSSADLDLTVFPEQNGIETLKLEQKWITFLRKISKDERVDTFSKISQNPRNIDVLGSKSILFGISQNRSQSDFQSDLQRKMTANAPFALVLPT